MNAAKPIKIIVSMIGLDGHTTGGEVVARILRDAGMEVIYLGVNQTPEMIARAAVQEDVDAIGISSHAANYSQITELMDLLARAGLRDVLVVCGGTIPRRRVEELKEKGVAEVFLPRSTSESIVRYILANVRAPRTPPR
ncbi:MAG: cobalamin B12-binding domain-containing protein [Deltaproteobacteria bacterium]|nr:cobalamin B12-binding domain-containing protein [Deltaproteobacteria bacterium]